MAVIDISYVWVPIGGLCTILFFLWKKLAIKDEIIIDVLNNEIGKILNTFAENVRLLDHSSTKKLEELTKGVQKELQPLWSALDSLENNVRILIGFSVFLALSGFSFTAHVLGMETFGDSSTIGLGIIFSIFTFFTAVALTQKYMENKKLYLELRIAK